MHSLNIQFVRIECNAQILVAGGMWRIREVGCRIILVCVRIWSEMMYSYKIKVE